MTDTTKVECMDCNAVVDDYRDKASIALCGHKYLCRYALGFYGNAAQPILALHARAVAAEKRVEELEKSLNESQWDKMQLECQQIAQRPGIVDGNAVGVVHWREGWTSSSYACGIPIADTFGPNHPNTVTCPACLAKLKEKEPKMETPYVDKLTPEERKAREWARGHDKTNAFVPQIQRLFDALDRLAPPPPAPMTLREAAENLAQTTLKRSDLARTGLYDPILEKQYSDALNSYRAALDRERGA